MKSTYTVAVLGFDQTEKIVLASIFGLAARRSPKFMQVSSSGPSPDIYLVDASDPEAVTRFKATNGERRVPSIVIGDSDQGTGWPVLKRPLQWTRLFKAFDLAVTLPPMQRVAGAGAQQAAGHVSASAPTMRITPGSSVHGGLPAGSEIQIGYAEADVQAPAPKSQQPVAPGSPKPGKKKSPKRPKPSHGHGQLPLLPAPSGLQPKLTAGGYVFPVYGPSSFGDTYGAFRGDVPGNWHHGDDIFAPLGAPVLACADGIVFSVGWNEIGGNRFWIRDQAGNEFYYAHLSAFSPLAKNGRHVKAGDVLGFVGNTGDAAGTPTHLHFEVHPESLVWMGYDGAVDPTAYLTAWKHLQDVRFENVAGWVPAGAVSDPAPKPGAILLQVSDISEASGLDPGSLERAITPRAPGEGDDALLRSLGFSPPSNAGTDRGG